MAKDLTPERAIAENTTVYFSPRQPRAFISALLLLVQLLGLGHVALARHVLSDTAAVVDVAGLVVETHHDRGGHLCCDDVAIHFDAQDECLVFAARGVPSLHCIALALQLPEQPRVREVVSSSFIAAQLDVLSRAPKASPPQG